MILAEIERRLRAVPWRKVHGAAAVAYQHYAPGGVDAHGSFFWEPDYAALAREALAFVAERLPTEDELAGMMPKLSVYDFGTSRWTLASDMISARHILRDLRGRLGVQGYD